MKTPHRVLQVTVVVLAAGTFSWIASAQNQQMQERVAEVKALAARNKQALMQYTWVEEVTISLKGEQKKAGAFPGSARP
jgi:hypothetical protein